MEKLLYNPNLVYKLLSENNSDKAIQHCINAIEITPQNPEIYNALGFIHGREGNYHEAIKNLLQAISLHPTNHLFHNNISNAYKNIGDFNKALIHINECLRINPNYAEGFNNLGNIYLKQKLYTKAISCFEKAIRLHPQYISAHFNLANTLIKEDKFSQAVGHYEEILNLDPNNIPTKQNLAMAYIENRSFDKAIPMLENLIKNSTPSIINNEVYIHLAEAYLDTGKTELAINTYEKAINNNPDTEFLHHNFAILLLREQKTKESLEHFKQALAINPKNQTAMHMINAIEQDKNTKTAPPEYVENLFDQYASYYDKHVSEKLQYKTPAKLREVVAKYTNEKTKLKNILDLGCGTGLCSIYFRDISANLVGVDLSKNMLLHAKKLKSYDLLVKSDISNTIPGENNNFFDYIIAADVFVYIGELDSILRKCKSALNKSGKILFTIEKLSNNNKNFILNKTGRFLHSHKYIEQICENNKMNIIYNEDINLRENNKEKVIGTIFVIENKE